MLQHSMDTFDVILTSYNFKQTYVNEMNSAIKKASQAGIGYYDNEAYGWRGFS